ncbi:O-antigen ligase family protein [Emticicia sp. 17c]|uniref:O-antigen ligase family protein n=1 Tax=Emticicia sp. 17c TaxID=3127704 RepID=UPI00301B9AE9
MENNVFYTTNRNVLNNIWLIPGIIIAMAFGWMIANKGLSIGVMITILPFVIGFVIMVFFRPRWGIIFYLVYCFLMPTLGKHIDGVQFGLGMDGLLILTFLAVIFHRSGRYRFRHLNNDLVWVAVVWFVITILQIGNPERPSILGWVYEMRSSTLYWVLTIPLALLLLNKKTDINLFLNIIIVLSLLGALWGIKQLKLGPDEAENRWLEAGAKKTHILFGKLRVFSYYSEAAQFGASQAQLAIMCIILAVGPHSKLKKLWYIIAGLFILYGMIISGTRGALFGFVGGGLVFLILSKQIRILILGGIVGLAFLGMLKYTSIGSGNAEIVRLRTSLDPNDASFQVRLINQKILRDFLASKPFGAGVGTMGTWGTTYNQDKFISQIPPDSLYVKVWGMYGIIGFIIWFGIMLYITGKSAGIIWKTQDPLLKNQLIALCGGATGILLCSYGNEVLNAMPSSVIVYISWALIWLSPRWDTPVPKTLTPVTENEF